MLRRRRLSYSPLMLGLLILVFWESARPPALSQTHQGVGDRHPNGRSAVARVLASEDVLDVLWEDITPRPSEEAGFAGLVLTLRALRTTARLLHVTAHPDDEDGGMLAFVSRGLGAQVMLLTLTRGEGGQNKTGPELLDALGLVRTLELLAADAYYGVSQRFTHVADFGFSKTADETFAKWGGRQGALADVVRVIRAFRPDVIVARFHGAPRDGHGNHQAAGWLAREAFEAAGDPQRFPDQSADGMLPWTPKKLYVSVRADEPHTLRLNVGAYDPILGHSYAQFAMRGLSLQLTQGAGGVVVPSGDRFAFYRLLASRVPTHSLEESFFDGLDTSLPGLASRLGEEERLVPFLRPALEEFDRAMREAVAALTPWAPERAARPLLMGLNLLDDLIPRLERAPLSPQAREDVLIPLRTKRAQCVRAIAQALGLTLEALVDPPETAHDSSDRAGNPAARPAETPSIVSPGQTITLTVRMVNRGREQILPQQILCDAPPEFGVKMLQQELRPLGPHESASARCQVTIPQDLSPAWWTRPHWWREDPYREAVVRLTIPEYRTLPLPPLPLRVRARYALEGFGAEISAGVRARVVDPLYGEHLRPLFIVPALSVSVSPESVLGNAAERRAISVTVSVRHHGRDERPVTLRVDVPEGWRVTPATHAVRLSRPGEVQSASFTIFPDRAREGSYDVRAIAESQGQRYTEGYTILGRREIGWFPFFRPATVRVHMIDLKLPAPLRIGYVMGAGDEIPTALAQLGMKVEMLTPQDVAHGDLTRFDVIVLGIRAYDVRADVREHTPRLLEFVARGGTLLVQYNQNIAAFNAGRFTPYPATLGPGRVSVEEATVRILVPEDPIFRSPHRITERDFQGWVQERGLYFLASWDARFIPLLASGDPGEPPLEGGLVRARYGRGLYIYTGYAFFRQIPAGVPGATRLFVNLLYAGRTSAVSRSPRTLRVRERAGTSAH